MRLRRIHITTLAYLFLILAALSYLSLNPTVLSKSNTVDKIGEQRALADNTKIVVMLCDENLALCMPKLTPSLPIKQA